MFVFQSTTCVHAVLVSMELHVRTYQMISIVPVCLDMLAKLVKTVSILCHIVHIIKVRIRVFNATFNNISVISWWSVLLMEENGVAGENQRPVPSH